ncbi:MAG: cohesin domain-containing protein [Patescibacteria group bacterium]
MNIYIKKLLIATFLFLLGLLFIPSSVLATTFDLIAPTGQLTSGQEIKFTINIDTEGKSLSSTSIGMSYDTAYLQYVSTSPGNTFTTVSSTTQDGGKLIINGSSTTPYTGSGAYAYVTFKLIATQAGSTQLCALYNPVESTPTPGPTSPPGSPTTPPAAPTALPNTGGAEPTTKGVVLAAFFFILATGGFLIFKKI